MFSRAHLLAVGLATLPTLALAQAPEGAADDTSLPVRRVTLYTSGVGLFEHAGELPEGGEVKLAFDAEQLNDVLKSLAVSGARGVPRVRYASQEPLARQLQSFGIDLSGDPSLPALLSQLRGATVTVTTPEPVTGRVLNVTARQRVVGEPATQVTEHFLTLVTGAGIRSIAIDAVNSITIDDDKLRSELDAALALLAESRDADTKPVTIDFGGDDDDGGTRDVGVLYLVETPVWKTSYRLDLSDAEGEDANARLQGWAIIENTTDTDWEDVGLTLISGRPISFVQDLYTPLYLQRPTVQPELYASLQPKRYEGGWGPVPPAAPAPADSRRAFEEAPAFALGAGASATAGERVNMEAQRAQKFGFDASAAQSATAVGNVGELFRYTLDEPIDLPRKGSAMVPILSGVVTSERLSIYNRNTHPTHPLSGAKLTNSTELKLMSGPITVYEGDLYLGDALIPFMGPGDERLVSYAVDLETRVDPTESTSSDLVDARIVRGVLQLRHKTTYTQAYAINNEADNDKTLVIEHPRHAGRDLVQPQEPAEKTENVYRFRAEAPAGETTRFVVKEEQTNWQGYAITDMTASDLLAHVRRGKIEPEVRDALQKAAELKGQEAELRRQAEALEKEYRAIAEDQSRIRNNMARVNANTSLHQRYMQKLADQETQIETIQTKIDEATEAANAKQRELADYLQGLTVGD